jgi:hypothetical protein
MLAAIERNLMRDGFVDRYPTRDHVDGLPRAMDRFLPAHSGRKATCMSKFRAGKSH